MKKVFLSIVFVIALMLALTACNKPVAPDGGGDNHTCTPGETETNVWTRPTCEYEGEAEVITGCIDCGRIIERNVITLEKLPHTPGEAEEIWEQEATCYQEGIYYEVISCVDCGETISNVEKTVPKTNEHWEKTKEENRVEPTCTADGSYELVTYCNYYGCGEELSRETKIIEMLDHSPASSVKENVVDSTCTEAGSYDEVEYCKDCNTEISRESKVISISDHVPSSAVIENNIDSTCTVNGNYDEVIYCVDCSIEISRENKVSPLLPHTIVSGICSVCNEKIGNTGLKYTLSGGSYIVSGIGDCIDTHIVIPSTYNNIPVTSIGSDAFEGCKNIISITIPNSVTSISDEAFHNCSGLSSVTFGENSQLTSIGERAFYGCSGLTSIEIPNSVTSIGEWAFTDCSGLLRVTFEDNSQLTSIGSCAFWLCTGLTSIEIPNSVTGIGSSAFYGCSSLESITLPFVGNGVNGTGNHFEHIFGLQSYTVIYNQLDRDRFIPSSLKTVTITGGTKIGNLAFYGCYGLTSISIPNSVISIGSHSFSYCKDLTSITFGENSQLTTIGEEAFRGCSSLTSVTIPEKVTSIGDYAFQGCYRLVEVCNKSPLDIVAGRDNNGYIASHAKNIITNESESNLKNIGDFICYIHEDWMYIINYIGKDSDIVLFGNCGVKNYVINDYAFYNCSSITSIKGLNFYRFIGDSAFRGCTGLTSIEIPSNVTSIGDSAFWGCTGLTSIEIPNSVTSIGGWAFCGCTSLESITLPFAGKSPNATKEEAHFGYIFGYTPHNSNLSHFDITSIKYHYYDGEYYYYEYLIPESLTSVTITGNEIQGFNGCNSLTNIVVSNSVISIDNRAFLGCISLTDVYYTGTEDEWAAIEIGTGNDALTNVTIHYNYVPEE